MCKLLDFIVSLPEQKVSTDNSSSNRSKFSSTSRANLSNCACICCVCTFISSCNDKEYHKNILLVSCSCSNSSSCKSVKRQTSVLDNPSLKVSGCRIPTASTVQCFLNSSCKNSLWFLMLYDRIKPASVSASCAETLTKYSAVYSIYSIMARVTLKTATVS